jgi:hypothetical protein
MWHSLKRKRKTKDKKQKRRYPRQDGEHNFDKDLTDEEFFEIMEDD